MHGKKLPKDGASRRDSQEKKSVRRNKSLNSRKLRTDKEGAQAISELSKTEGTAFGCGIYPAAKRAAKERGTKRRGKNKQRNCETSNACGIAGEFTVRCWAEVMLKYRAVEQFRGKYLGKAMGEAFEVS